MAEDDKKPAENVEAAPKPEEAAPEPKAEEPAPASTGQPTVAEQAKAAAAEADKNEEDIVKPKAAPEKDLNKTLEAVDEQLKAEKSAPKKHASVGLAVGVALFVALVLIILGVLAYQNSDTSSEVDGSEANTDTTQQVEPITEGEVQSELDAAEQDLDNLEEDLNDLGTEDLSDENLDLQ